MERYFRRLWERYPKRIVAVCGTLITLGFVIWLVSATTTAPIDSYLSCANQGYPITDTNPPLCSDGAHDYLGPPSPSPTPQAMLVTQPFSLLVDGDSGGTYPARMQVITNQADWVAYWHTVNAQLPAIPPILNVNFANSDVVALSQGREQTAGYLLEITDIESSPTGSVVNVTNSIPTTTCPVANTVTNPYFIASTAKLPPPVRFSTNTTYRKCL